MLTDWQWLPCSFDLKRELKKKIEYFNLGNQASFFCEGKVSLFLIFFEVFENEKFQGNRNFNDHKNGQKPAFLPGAGLGMA